MRLKIQLSSIISANGPKTVDLEVSEDEISLKEFIHLLSKQEWGEAVVENGRIKPPLALFVDDELILMKTNPTISIRKSSKIRIVPFLSGG